MSIWLRLIAGFRAIAGRGAADRDITDEVGHFLEEAVAARQSQGLSDAEARRAVRLDVGHAVAIEEQLRESSRPSSVQLFDSVWQDLRHGCRVLAHNLGFSVVALSILTIGIGAATTIFSFVDGVLLKPLPYEHGDRIVRLVERRPDGASSGLSTPAYLDWRSNSTLFEEMAAQQQGLVTMTGASDAVPLRVGRVTARYFDVFGVTPFLGRTFADGEDEPGKEHVVVLSHALWENQFGSNARIVGTTILLDDESYTIVGVLPADSAFDRGVAQLWHPLAFRPANLAWDYRWLTASYVRLKPEVSLEQARAQMDAIGKRIAAENPNSNRGWGVVVERYADAIVGPQLRTSLLALIGAVAGLLLICCSNLAGLVLVRAVSRRTEIAVRAALGASRRRLLQQLFIEHATLTAAGSILGVAAASAAIGWLNRTLPRGVLPSEAIIHLDVRVVAFALGVAAVTGILFGLTPALRGGSPHLAGAMGRRGATPSRARRRLLDALVIGEVAVAFILLCGSALLIRSLVQLINVETGFVADSVLTMRLPVPGFPPGSRYSSPDEFKTYLRSVEASINSIPGVQHSGLTNAVPLTDCCLYSLNMQIANRPVVDRANRGGGFFKVVTPGYFSSLGLKLRKGRFLDGRDTGNAVPAIVVNERLANRYFPGEDPIGQHILNPGIVPGRTERGPDIAWEIVGVVANEKIGTLSDDNSAVLYASYEQSPVYFANLVVRAALGPNALEKAIRRALFDLNKSQAVLDVRTLEQLKSASVASSRVQAELMSSFSAIAIVLAAIGMYGVLAYSVVLRRREIGIRAALGASSSMLLRAVLGQGLFVTLLGLTIGMIGAFALAPLLGSVLYNVQSRDPLLMTIATTILIIVGLLASVIPARRAANVDPIAVLRGD